jgi:uncharacterized protein (TIGR02444 family)
MRTEDSPLDAEQEWRSVVAIYARPGVSQACLLLQDMLGVDVLVLLHLAFVQNKYGVPMGLEHVGAADDAVRQWRNTVVKPLRAVRRTLSKTDPAVGSLRAEIQQCELNAERHGLRLLAAVSPRDGWSGGKPDMPNQVVGQVVHFYGTRNACLAQISAPQVAEAIRLLEQSI